jgi:CRP-like cAMP-binding protein
MMKERRKSPLDSDSIPPHLCSVDLRLQILGRVPFFAGLPIAQLKEINSRFREQGYSSEQVIYYAGDDATRLFVVADGKVKLVRHTLIGKDILLDMLTPGEFFGSLSALGDDQYPDTAIAQTPACVLGIGTDDFRAILDSYPAVALKVIGVMAARLRAAHERVRQLSAHSVERRVAYTLLKLGEKLGREDELGLLIEVPLSRDDLAQMTGTTTETASRVMSQFQKQGLIRSGRQWVAIADRAGLEALVREEID